MFECQEIHNARPWLALACRARRRRRCMCISDLYRDSSAKYGCTISFNWRVYTWRVECRAMHDSQNLEQLHLALDAML